jgi:hypothetical protein
MAINDYVLYYNMDSASVSGTSLTDNSGNGNTGTLVGSPTTGAVGKIGQAITFAAASSQYVDGGTATATNVGSGNPITVACWLNLASNPSTPFSFIANGTGSSLVNWELRKLSGTTVDFFSYVSANYQGIQINLTAPTGTWFHLVGIWTGSAWQVYYNGALETNVALSINDGIGPGGGVSHFYVGVEPGLTRYLDGSIDEVRIYNRALSSTEVTALYNFTGSTSRLLSLRRKMMEVA